MVFMEWCMKRALNLVPFKDAALQACLACDDDEGRRACMQRAQLLCFAVTCLNCLMQDLSLPAQLQEGSPVAASQPATLHASNVPDESPECYIRQCAQPCLIIVQKRPICPSSGHTMRKLQNKGSPRRSYPTRLRAMQLLTRGPGAKHAASNHKVPCAHPFHMAGPQWLKPAQG